MPNRLFAILAAGAILSLFAAAAVAQDFPAVFEHRFGATTIGKKPERVVTLSYLGQDQFLSLGVKPVGSREWYGGYPYGAWPWASAALGEAKPVMIGEDIVYEQVAALQPDVIEALWSGLTAEQYAELSKIAPVVAAEAQYSDYGTPWYEQTKTIGRIVGKVAEADALVAAINQRFAAIAAGHPEWQGRTAAIAYAGGSLGAFLSDDIRSQMLGQLGLLTPPAISALGQPGQSWADLSPEDLSPIDADVPIWFDGNSDPAPVKALTLRDRMRAHREGREIFAGKLLSGAFSYASPISINYLLDQLVPEIELAIDGDPATVVATAKEAGLID